jgi:MYXO-CTERM domain-containing protein
LLLAAASPGSIARAAPTIYEINFDERPAYLPNNTVVLTFDDGPDDTNTAKTLDVLKQKNVKATFFINTDNAANVNDSPEMQALVRRIVDEGHELANHSVHHLALALLKPAELEDEIAGVEQAVCNAVGARAPRLTLFRAPFGDPYLGPLHGVGYDWIAPIVAKHAVHIGWALDSNDWRTPDNPDAVFANVSGLLKTPGQGSYGIILMHSIHPQTVAALPRIIDYIRNKGFVFKLTEDVVRARFGKVSASLIPGTKTCTGAGTGADGGAPDGPGDATDGGPSAADSQPANADASNVIDAANVVLDASADARSDASIEPDAGRDASGGSGGGPGGSSGTGGRAGTGGSGAGGAGVGDDGEGGTTGSGSRHAASRGCAYRAPDAPARGRWWLLLGLVALAISRRRRS